MCTDFQTDTSCIGRINSYIGAVILTAPNLPHPHATSLPAQRELLGTASDDVRRMWHAWHTCRSDLTQLTQARAQLACVTCPHAADCPELTTRPTTTLPPETFPCVKHRAALDRIDEDIGLTRAICSTLWSLVETELHHRQFLDERGNKLIIDGPDLNVYLIPH